MYMCMNKLYMNGHGPGPWKLLGLDALWCDLSLILEHFSQNLKP